MEIARNKKAYFDYEILDTLEAGMVLLGHETKSVRNNQINLKGGYIQIRNREAWLENVHISPYQPKNNPEYDPLRKRKLLLQKRELERLEKESGTAGITLVPLKIFLKNNRIKLLIGIARGKKAFDKRETIKRRETDREIQKRLKR